MSEQVEAKLPLACSPGKLGNSEAGKSTILGKHDSFQSGVALDIRDNVIEARTYGKLGVLCPPGKKSQQEKQEKIWYPSLHQTV